LKNDPDALRSRSHDRVIGEFFTVTWLGRNPECVVKAVLAIAPPCLGC
jgi:hypothetical protein